MNALKDWGPMTVLMVAIALIVVLVGGVSVLMGDYDNDFVQWVEDLTKLAIGAGLLGVGRGVLKGKQAEAASDIHRDTPEAKVTDEDNQRDLHEHGLT